MSLKQTCLTETHKSLGAKMAEFGGFEMPIQYSSVKDEATCVRAEVGVFDVSHMGEFFVEGPEANKFIDYMMTNDFLSAPIGKAVYSPICREDGTIIDDLIAYKLGDTKSLICVNASNIEKDFKWFEQHAPKFDCKLEDRSADYSLIALQGPKSQEILTSLKIAEANAITNLPYYGVLELPNCIIARTGYTGEDGFEIFASHQDIKNIWQNLMELNVKPCGLAARDVLRLEVCFPLYGNELTDEVTPLDSALKWCVKLNKPEFIGKSILEELKPKYQIVKLSLEKGIPRQGYEVIDAKENVIGVITSGTMSVTNNKGIALARIARAQVPEDKKFFIKIRNKVYDANLHTKAFVSGGHK